MRSGEHITEQYFYNDQGNLVRSEFYNGDGKLKNWNESKYDEREIAFTPRIPMGMRAVVNTMKTPFPFTLWRKMGVNTGGAIMRMEEKSIPR